MYLSLLDEYVLKREIRQVNDRQARYGLEHFSGLVTILVAVFFLFI